MNKNWPRKQISELCDLIVDCVNKTAPVVPYTTEFKMIRTSNIKNGRIDLSNCRYVEQETFSRWTRRANLQKGDVLLTREAPMGEVGLVNFDDKAFLGQRVMQYRPNPKVLDSNFLLYSFLSSDLQYQFNKYSNGGSIVSHICVPDCFEFEISTPPISTQLKISKVLSDLDAKIELNNRINAELEAMAKLVYEYWFVQFDYPISPEQAEMMGDPTLIGKPYKSSGGKMVWNEELKRDLPEGWEVQSMDYWIEKDKNGDWGKEEIDGNYDLRVSCIRGADINGLNGNGDIKSPVRYILEKNSHKILEPGDLVIEISGGSPVQSTGRLGYIINETLERFNEPIICSNFCKAITLKEESNQFNFIYEWKRLYDAGIFFGYEGKTSGIKNFLFESFVSKHKIVIPPQELTEKFYEKALPIHSKIQKNLVLNQQLSSLRDWLLPMLMNGQVTVAEVEERVEEELGMVAEERIKYNKIKK